MKIWRVIAVGRIGRPRLRWEGDVREDGGRMRIQNWSEMTMGREAQK
jgi:hypothetical protein